MFTRLSSTLSFQFLLPEKEVGKFSLIKFKGKDCERFLNGQLTNNVSKLERGYGHYQARLDQTGRVRSWFYLAKDFEGCFWGLVEEKLKKELISDIDKYIIMDDIELEIVEKRINIILNADPDLNRLKGFYIPLFGVMSFVDLNCEHTDFEECSEEDLEALKFFSSQPNWETINNGDQLINETILNDLAVDYKKGCFLGQETAAKIQNNRGSANYPVFIKVAGEKPGIPEIPEMVGTNLYVEEKKKGKILKQYVFEGETYFYVSLNREFRVKGLEIPFSIEGQHFIGSVYYAPMIKASFFKEKAFEIYERGINIFQNENEDEAIKYFERAIKFDNKFADAFESIGVILGRQRKYEEGLGVMDKLLKVDPDSVMAHTNKSLFYMNLGKIEEAEKEKAEATVKSFGMFGKESGQKKILEEEKKKKEIETLKREQMFKEVLGIDANDTLANFGLGNICLERKKFDEAKEHLEKVLAQDVNYSVAYLVLGKSFEGLRKRDEAVQVYKKGIKIASKKGDLMPANEMQTRLTKLL
jgi:folate-binding protein YgfZ